MLFCKAKHDKCMLSRWHGQEPAANGDTATRCFFFQETKVYVQSATSFQVPSFSFNFFCLRSVLLSQCPEVLDDKETGGKVLKFPFKVCAWGGGIEGTSYRQEVGGCRLPQRQYFPHPPLTTNKRKTEIKALPSKNNKNSKEKGKMRERLPFGPVF